MQTVKPIRVLLAEHSQEARTLLGDFLAHARGLALAGVAADGIEALEAVQRLSPDLLLTELILPGLSGLGVIRELAKQDGPRPKILVVSRVTDPAMISQALELGAGFYLIKPVNLAELPALIAGLCDTRPLAVRLLADMGGKENSRAFRCARAAAELLATAPEHVQMKEIYLQTARQEDTTPLCVEKNIRKLIARLMEADAPAWRALWDLPPEKRPSNSAFLRAYANQLNTTSR